MMPGSSSSSVSDIIAIYDVVFSEDTVSLHLKHANYAACITIVFVVITYQPKVVLRKTLLQDES